MPSVREYSNRDVPLASLWPRSGFSYLTEPTREGWLEILELELMKFVEHSPARRNQVRAVWMDAVCFQPNDHFVIRMTQPIGRRKSGSLATLSKETR